MKRSLFVFFALGVLAALATAEDKPAARPAPTAAADTGVSAPPPNAPAADAKVASTSSALLRYLPPARGAPRMRVGAGTRGNGAPGARIEALSPEDLGRTLSASPSLYWHLSQPTQARVDFTLIDPSSVSPLVERTLEGPFEAGVHRIDLTHLGVKLAPGTEYQWFVSLVPDPEERSSDVVAGGGVELVDAGALREELARAPDSQQVLVLAQNGIWYDAIDALSRRIDQTPADPLPREQRAALLEQVGLADVAAAERAAPPPQQ